MLVDSRLRTRVQPAEVSLAVESMVVRLMSRGLRDSRLQEETIAKRTHRPSLGIKPRAVAFLQPLFCALHHANRAGLDRLLGGFQGPV